MARTKTEPQDSELPPEPKQTVAPGSVLMTRDDQTAEIAEGESVAVMEALGWKVVG